MEELTVSHYTSVLVEDQWREQQLPLELVFDKEMPLHVVMKFTEPTGDVVDWVVDRALMKSGLEEPTGAGDVQFWPGDASGDLIAINLASDEGSVMMRVSSFELRVFLTRTEELLPIGAEGEILQAQVDAWLAELFPEES